MPVELEMVLRIMLAMALGAIIGFQRGKAEKPAGMRDLILISAGSALCVESPKASAAITSMANIESRPLCTRALPACSAGVPGGRRRWIV